MTIRSWLHPKAWAVCMVRLYQWTIRPLIGPRCRYLPHCSDYAIEALSEYGLFSGSWLTLKRLGRCHPGCAGGIDPVPPRPLKKSDDPVGPTQHHRRSLPASSFDLTY